MVVGDRTDALELIANSASVSLVGQPGLDAGHSAPGLGIVYLGVVSRPTRFFRSG